MEGSDAAGGFAHGVEPFGGSRFVGAGDFVLRHQHGFGGHGHMVEFRRVVEQGGVALLPDARDNLLDDARNLFVLQLRAVHNAAF